MHTNYNNTHFTFELRWLESSPKKNKQKELSWSLVGNSIFVSAFLPASLFLFSGERPWKLGCIRSFPSSPHRAAFHATSLYLSTLSPSHCRPRFPTCSEPKTSYTSALLGDKPPSSICAGKKIICASIPFAPYTTTIHVNFG